MATPGLSSTKYVNWLLNHWCWSVDVHKGKGVGQCQMQTHVVKQKEGVQSRLFFQTISMNDSLEDEVILHCILLAGYKDQLSSDVFSV